MLLLNLIVARCLPSGPVCITFPVFALGCSHLTSSPLIPCHPANSHAEMFHQPYRSHTFASHKITQQENLKTCTKPGFPLPPKGTSQFYTALRSSRYFKWTYHHPIPLGCSLQDFWKFLPKCPNQIKYKWGLTPRPMTNG